MNAGKQIEEMALTEVDILANDLNQHCADLAENYCGGTTCLSCLAHALTAKGYRKASEVAREVCIEIGNRFKSLLEMLSGGGTLIDAKTFIDVHWEFIEHSVVSSYDAELKKKYTEDK